MIPPDRSGWLRVPMETWDLPSPNPAQAPREAPAQEQAQARAGEPGSATLAAARACSVQAQRDDRVGPHGRTG